MPELGRAALVVTLGLTLYALVAGGAAAYLGRRRLAQSAQNALVAAFLTTAVASALPVRSNLSGSMFSPGTYSTAMSTSGSNSTTVASYLRPLTSTVGSLTPATTCAFVITRCGA